MTSDFEDHVFKFSVAFGPTGRDTGMYESRLMFVLLLFGVIVACKEGSYILNVCERRINWLLLAVVIKNREYLCKVLMEIGRIRIFVIINNKFTLNMQWWYSC